MNNSTAMLIKNPSYILFWLHALVVGYGVFGVRFIPNFTVLHLLVASTAIFPLVALVLAVFKKRRDGVVYFFAHTALSCVQFSGLVVMMS